MSTQTAPHHVIGKRFRPMNGPEYQVVEVNAPLVVCAMVCDGIADLDYTRNFTIKELGWLFQA